MAFSGITVFIIIFMVLIIIGIPIGIFFAIRALLRYHAKLNQAKSPQQEELERMKLDDL